MSGRPAEKIRGGPWWECEGPERQLGLDQRGQAGEGLLAAAGERGGTRGAAVAGEPVLAWSGAPGWPTGQALRAGPARKERMGLKSCAGTGWRCQAEQRDKHDALVWAELRRTPQLSQRSVNADPSGFVSTSVLGAISQLVKLRGTGVTHLYMLL